MPMIARQAIHALASWTNIMPTIAGQVISSKKARQRRGPIKSDKKPTRARMTMLVETAAMLPEPI